MKAYKLSKINTDCSSSTLYITFTNSVFIGRLNVTITKKINRFTKNYYL